MKTVRKSSGEARGGSYYGSQRPTVIASITKRLMAKEKYRQSKDEKGRGKVQP